MPMGGRVNCRWFPSLATNFTRQKQALRGTMRCLIIIVLLAASRLPSVYAAVRQEDLQAWKGAPVSELDTHTIFLTMPVVRTRSDRPDLGSWVGRRR